ncbi:MAG TPA: PAS domain S-box protein [Smithellaceae bacterium]|nr:PAS domain S-box protein [Smithellaceae bacterium]
MSSFKTKNNYPTQINLFELSETITANIGVGVYIVQQGKFVYTSPIYRKLTGYAEHELIGVNSLEYVHPEDKDKVRQQAIKCLKGESSDSYEYRYIKKNGEIMWILEMITSIVYHGKRAALGSFMDITARKHMEEALRQSEERYRTVIEDIEEGYYEVDLQGNFTFASDSICATLGYPREELIGMSYKNYVPNEQFDYVYNIFKKVYETGKPIKSYSLINIRKNGERIHVEDSVAPLSDKNGKIIGFKGITRDITQRKIMEEILQKSEDYFREITENSSDVIIITESNGNIKYCSRSVERCLGYKPEELTGKNAFNFIYADDLPRAANDYSKAIQTKDTAIPNEFRVVHKDGSVRLFEGLGKNLLDNPSVAGFIMNIRDVTERKHLEIQKEAAQKSLRESEEKYRTILEKMEEGLFELDLKGNITFVNDAECRKLGYSREELTGMNYRQFQDENTAKKTRQIFSEVYKKEEPIQLLDVEIIRKNGSKAFNEISVSLLKDKQGKATGFRGISRDVTVRRQMEEMIRQSEEKYRTIINEVDEWYFEIDLAGNVIFVNDAIVRSVGYPPERLIGLNYKSFTSEERSGEVFKIFRQVYETREPIKNFPYEFVLPDGKITFFELSVFPKLDDQGKVVGFRGVGHDVTERKRTEEQLNYIATHDFLTGLPNRMLLMDRLKMATAQAKRNAQKLALMMLDLDNFKNVNDSLGHMVGDKLLKEISLRLTGRLRQNDTICRLGGDEFIILLPAIERVEDAVEVAKIILESFEQSFICNDHLINSSISIGIAIYPDDAQDIDVLMKNADMAMYYVKAHGRNGYHLFSYANNRQFSQTIQ